MQKKAEKEPAPYFADAGSFLPYRFMAKDRLYFSLSERYTEIPAVPTGRRISPALLPEQKYYRPPPLTFSEDIHYYIIYWKN